MSIDGVTNYPVRRRLAVKSGLNAGLAHDLLWRLALKDKIQVKGKSTVLDHYIGAPLAEDLSPDGCRKQILEYERLAHKLADIFGAENMRKSLGLSVANNPRTHIFQEVARALVAAFRETSSLHIEIQRFFFRSKTEASLRSSVGLDFCGTQAAFASPRKQRLRTKPGAPELKYPLQNEGAQNFWQQYHASPRGHSSRTKHVSGLTGGLQDAQTVVELRRKRNLEVLPTFSPRERSSDTAATETVGKPWVGEFDSTELQRAGTSAQDRDMEANASAVLEQSGNMMQPIPPDTPRGVVAERKQTHGRRAQHCASWRDRGSTWVRKVSKKRSPRSPTPAPCREDIEEQDTWNPTVMLTEVPTHDSRPKPQLDPLPQFLDTFVEPWREHAEEAPSLAEGEQVRRYLRACERHSALPCALPFIVNGSPKIDVEDRGLVDRDLCSMTAAVRACVVEEVNFKGNLMLTEISLVPFIQKLFGGRAQSTLKTLNLRSCVRAGPLTFTTLAELLCSSAGAQQLRSLDVSRIPLGKAQLVSLCAAIGGHPSLHSAFLADTGIGRSKGSAKTCIVELFKCTTLRVLDLGWNLLDDDAYETLGGQIIATQTITNLSVANCTASSGSNLDRMIEHLVSDRTLERLDLSMNRMDMRVALVLEDAFAEHRRLGRLDVSRNPLGAQGLRCVLRLLARRESGLRYITFEQCAVQGASSEIAQTYNATNPFGQFKFNLARSHHRAHLRILYKTCDRLGLDQDSAFTAIVASSSPYAHPQKDANGVRRVPEKGKVALTFSIQKALENQLRHIDEGDFGEFVQRHLRMTRLKPGFIKWVSLLAAWKFAEGKAQEQILLLEALSKDFVVTYPQLRQLCQVRLMIRDVMWHLLPCLDGRSPGCVQYLALMIPPTPNDLVVVLSKMQVFLRFNVENPTGQYKLDLGTPADHAVAERLRLLDTWESFLGLKNELLDVSQKGNRSQIRNVRHKREDLGCAVAEWSIQEREELELDYVSNKRLHPNRDGVPSGVFVEMLRALHFSSASLSSEGRIAAIRSISNLLCVTSMQVRELMNSFMHTSERVELVVMFFLRVIDIQNAKLFCVRLGGCSELRHVWHRLGYATGFPFIQPEGTEFDLDFAFHDQRIAANMLLKLSGKERRENLRRPRFVVGGVEEQLTLGVPRQWDAFEKMPRQGVFSVTYFCSPENRNLALRMQLAKTYGFWDVQATDANTSWWSNLSEAPQDVLELLEFLIARFPNLNDAFKKIDGPDGNGALGLRELQTGLRRLGCKKFGSWDTPEPNRRIEEIFRFLDPGGEGEVSETEWSTLKQLWMEISLSIAEFVQFADRTFGRLEEAWAALDVDNSGTISEDEWSEVTTSAGYFGPALPVFRFIDKDDGGSISEDEFVALEAFKA